MSKTHIGMSETHISPVLCEETKSLRNSIARLVLIESWPCRWFCGLAQTYLLVVHTELCPFFVCSRWLAHFGRKPCSAGTSGREVIRPTLGAWADWRTNCGGIRTVGRQIRVLTMRLVSWDGQTLESAARPIVKNGDNVNANLT